MSDSPYRNPADFSSTETAHCLFCGAERNEHGNCGGCGARVAAPSNDDPLDTGRACPRCASPLRREPFGRAVVKACGKCHGLFVPALQFSMIVNDYLADMELPLGKYPPAPPRSKDEADPRWPQVSCIACDAQMDRVNFASRSGAIVDVCEKHGIWIDGGELVPMLHFVKTRAELGEVPLSNEERADQAQLDIRIEQAKHRKVALRVNFFTTLEYLRRNGF